MFAATLATKDRSECGTVAVRAQPRVKLERPRPLTSGVKRSMLAMSMRFSYDTADNWAVISEPSHDRSNRITHRPLAIAARRPGAKDVLPQHML